MTKLMSLSEAIAQYVGDGDVLYAAGFTHLIPFAAGHEITGIDHDYVLPALDGKA